MSSEPGFLGTGWAFPPAFDGPAGAAAMAAGEEEVQQALRILLSTRPGERVMRPTWGAGLRRFVFESMDQNLLTALRDAIERAVRFHEPRVLLERVDITADEALEGRLTLSLHYRLRSANVRRNLVLPFYLDPAEADS